MKMIPDEITPQYRAALACRIIDALRRALTENGNEYSGALVPNLQSVRNIMTASNKGLLRHLHKLPPELLPSPVEVALIGTWWRVDYEGQPPLES